MKEHNLLPHYISFASGSLQWVPVICNQIILYGEIFPHNFYAKHNRKKIKSLMLKETMTVRNFMTLRVIEIGKCRHLKFYTKLVNPRMNFVDL